MSTPLSIATAFAVPVVEPPPTQRRQSACVARAASRACRAISIGTCARIFEKRPAIRVPSASAIRSARARSGSAAISRMRFAPRASITRASCQRSVEPTPNTTCDGKPVYSNSGTPTPSRPNLTASGSMPLPATKTQYESCAIPIAIAYGWAQPVAARREHLRGPPSRLWTRGIYGCCGMGDIVPEIVVGLLLPSSRGVGDELVERARIEQSVDACGELWRRAEQDPLERGLELLSGQRSGDRFDADDPVRHMPR